VTRFAAAVRARLARGRARRRADRALLRLARTEHPTLDDAQEPDQWPATSEPTAAPSTAP
jgi:hypothetical protein